eukprot:TRINITY_DN69617_c0_g1_i1.p1 TRINITY_DN69617_c0_g1~~TRINITY_DN69617_c0_g1_i1.p1  ORF type:complete len:342 (-),score=79.69 TRINITY_DN69617_c0_g1_i1:85-1110(-)
MPMSVHAMGRFMAFCAAWLLIGQVSGGHVPADDRPTLEAYSRQLSARRRTGSSGSSRDHGGGAYADDAQEEENSPATVIGVVVGISVMFCCAAAVGYCHIAEHWEAKAKNEKCKARRAQLQGDKGDLPDSLELNGWSAEVKGDDDTDDGSEQRNKGPVVYRLTISDSGLVGGIATHKSTNKKFGGLQGTVNVSTREICWVESWGEDADFETREVWGSLQLEDAKVVVKGKYLAFYTREDGLSSAAGNANLGCYKGPIELSNVAEEAVLEAKEDEIETNEFPAEIEVKVLEAVVVSSGVVAGAEEFNGGAVLEAVLEGTVIDAPPSNDLDTVETGPTSETWI